MATAYVNILCKDIDIQEAARRYVSCKHCSLHCRLLRVKTWQVFLRVMMEYPDYWVHKEVKWKFLYSNILPSKNMDKGERLLSSK